MTEYEQLEDEDTGLVCRIYSDDFDCNPRTDMDNLCKLIVPERDRYIHNEYDLGLDWCDREHDEEILNSDHVYMWRPFYRYEHSGIAYSLGAFADPWDSGQCGYIIALREDVAEEFGKDIDNDRVRKLVEDNMRGEIELYSSYANGEVYGYTIADENDLEQESCWGFYGDDGLTEIEDEFRCYVDCQKKEAKEQEQREHKEANELLVASGIDIEELYQKEA